MKPCINHKEANPGYSNRTLGSAWGIVLQATLFFYSRFTSRMLGPTSIPGATWLPDAGAGLGLGAQSWWLFPEFPHCCFPHMDQASNFLCLDHLCAHARVRTCACVFICLQRVEKGEEGSKMKSLYCICIPLFLSHSDKAAIF